MREIQITEDFVEQTIQKRLALTNWRICINRGHPEFRGDIKRVEKDLKQRLRMVGGIDKFNAYVDAHNVQLPPDMRAEGRKIKPIEEWP